LVRTLVCAELGVTGEHGTFGELPYVREWRGRRHTIHVRFGNISDPDTMPSSALLAVGDTWRVVIDYPFDSPGRSRRDDLARIRDLERGSRTVFWVPLHLTEDVMSRVSQLAKINYLL